MVMLHSFFSVCFLPCAIIQLCHCIVAGSSLCNHALWGNSTHRVVPLLTMERTGGFDTAMAARDILDAVLASMCLKQKAGQVDLKTHL